MVKYAANLSMLYTEVDVLDRFKKAAEAGFTHVEMLFPFHYDLDRIERELKSNGLTMILFDTDAGDFADVDVVRRLQEVGVGVEGDVGRGLGGSPPALRARRW